MKKNYATASLEIMYFDCLDVLTESLQDDPYFEDFYDNAEELPW